MKYDLKGKDAVLFYESGKDRLDPIFKIKDKALQRYKLHYQYNILLYQVERVYVKDNTLRIFRGIYSPSAGNNGIYVTCTSKKGFSFNGKKLTYWWSTTKYEVITMIQDFADHLGLEWVKTVPHQLLTDKRILVGILSGKLTSPKDVAKAWIKYKLPKGTKLSPKLLLKAINIMDKKLYLTVSTILYLLKFEKYPEKLIKQIIAGKTPSMAHSTDIVEQCAVLDVKFSWTWSKERQEKEHNKMTHILMEKVKDLIQDNTVEYKGELKDIPYKGRVLQNEYEVFKEGTVQDNCVYTNYWSQVQYKSYLLLACEGPGGRFNVGISSNGKVDQIYYAHNKRVEDKIRDTFDEWIKKPETQKFLSENGFAPVDYSALGSSLSSAF